MLSPHLSKTSITDILDRKWKWKGIMKVKLFNNEPIGKVHVYSTSSLEKK